MLAETALYVEADVLFLIAVSENIRTLVSELGASGARFGPDGALNAGMISLRSTSRQPQERQLFAQEQVFSRQLRPGRQAHPGQRDEVS